MKYSDLKYNVVIIRDGYRIAARLCGNDDIHSTIEEEMLRIGFLNGDDKIEISLWNGGE